MCNLKETTSLMKAYKLNLAFFKYCYSGNYSKRHTLHFYCSDQFEVSRVQLMSCMYAPIRIL